MTNTIAMTSFLSGKHNVKLHMKKINYLRLIKNQNLLIHS